MTRSENANSAAESIGEPLDRVDGRLKVTGGALYALEQRVEHPAHAVILTSTIAKGRVKSVDTAAAAKAPGVLAVLTPENAPRLPGAQQGGGGGGRPAMRVPTLLQDDLVHYNGQPIGVVVANTLEQAMSAARLVRVRYAAEEPVLDMATAPRNPPDQVHPLGGERSYSRGDVEQGLRDADVRLDETYTTPLENHNPMEMHSSIAQWDGDAKLTLYESTQGIFSVRNTLARTFGLKPENVLVLSPFTGGGFGSKGGAWSHEVLAAMAAKKVGRPVKLSLTRQQMFGPVGGRPMTVQRVALGAKSDGTLTAIRHNSTSNTSTLEDWVEPALSQTRMLYACPNVATQYDLVRINVGSPTFQRAPGESTGTYALESAMDELAIALKMDPVQLRLAAYADRDPGSGHPWSSKALRDCYAVAAARFGWSKRNPEPRSMRNGRWLVGWGMATATYPARRAAAGASARMMPDGRAVIRAGSQEIGTGTYTVMTQIAADALGLPPDHVRFELGSTDMPENPASTGSVTAASKGSAVHEAATALKKKMDELAAGRTYASVFETNGNTRVEVTITAKPGAEQQQYSLHAFGAVFTEVHVDPDLGLIRVPRVVTAHDVGRVLNAKTARSQIQGGVVWGIGMALLEQTHIDPRTGRYVNADLAEYQVPVNADVGTIDVHFVDGHDAHVNPIGAKGAGEIGITGVAASIANAVYHATGRRVRDLPIRLEALL
jgi:xanthine dehydrogenase YagR molybdenum-binding subunit